MSEKDNKHGLGLFMPPPVNKENEAYITYLPYYDKENEHGLRHEDGRRFRLPPLPSAALASDSPPIPDDANPKDLVGRSKVPLWLFPATGSIYGAMAFKDGARKYGPYNWRSKKVIMTIYLDAIKRHVLALLDGEDDASDSGLPHLAHIIADAALLADALEGGMLIDDRPPPGPAVKVLEKFREKPTESL